MHETMAPKTIKKLKTKSIIAHYTITKDSSTFPMALVAISYPPHIPVKFTKFSQEIRLKCNLKRHF